MGPKQPQRRRRSDGLSDGKWSGVEPADFTQLAMWMAASLAGVATAMVLVRRPFFKDLARRLGWSRRPGRATGIRRNKPSPADSLPLLADALIGNTRQSIASVLGPPRNAVVVDPTWALPTFWEAQTWYYALPRGGKLAVAIHFEEDFARSVKFLQAPVPN